MDTKTATYTARPTDGTERKPYRKSLPPKKLPPGKHPAAGYDKAPSSEGVYRAKLIPATNKKRETDCDFYGTMLLSNCDVMIRLWCHDDNTVGLRLSKIQPKPTAPTKPTAIVQR